MGHAPGGGSDGAPVGAPGVSVPAFATTPPLSRTPRERQTPRPGGLKLLLLSLHNYRIVASLGPEKLSFVAFVVVADKGAGPDLVRRNALAPDWLLQVVLSKEEEQVRLRDANNARLRNSGTVTLRLQMGAWSIPVPFLVVDDLSVPVILG